MIEVEIQHEEIQGDEARVEALMTGPGNETLPQTFWLVLIDGAWLIDMGRY